MKKIFTLLVLFLGLSAYVSAQETVLWTGETTPEAITYFDFPDWVKTDAAINGKYVNFATDPALQYTSIVDNPFKEGVNSTDKALILKSLEGKSWWPDFCHFDLEAPISITESNRYLHIMHYRQNLNEGFSVNINIDTPWEDPDKGTKRFDANLVAPGQWEDIVIDLKWFMDNAEPLSRICMLIDRNWSANAEDPTDYYFDEIVLSDDPLQRGVTILEGTDLLNGQDQAQLDALGISTQHDENTYAVVDNPFTDSWLNADGKVVEYSKSNVSSWWQGLDVTFPGIHMVEYGVKQYLHVMVRTDTTCFIQLNIKDNFGIEYTEMFLYPMEEIDGDWFDLVWDLSGVVTAIKGFTVRFDVRVDDDDNYINGTPARVFYADEITLDAEEDPREGTDPNAGIEDGKAGEMIVYSMDNAIYFNLEGATRANVYDMSGRNIASKQLKNKSGLNSIQVPTQGIYILKVAADNKVSTAKVLVN